MKLHQSMLSAVINKSSIYILLKFYTKMFYINYMVIYKQLRLTSLQEKERLQSGQAIT